MKVCLFIVSSWYRLILNYRSDGTSELNFVFCVLKCLKSAADRNKKKNFRILFGSDQITFLCPDITNHHKAWVAVTSVALNERLSNMELLEMEIHHLTFQTITLSGFRADNIFQRDCPPTVLCVVFQTTLLAAAWILLRPSDAPLWLWTWCCRCVPRCKWTTKKWHFEIRSMATTSGIKPHSNVAWMCKSVPNYWNQSGYTKKTDLLWQSEFSCNNGN